MSITQWFKNLFSGGSQTDASLGDGQIDINEARIDAGGSGIMGVGQHDSPGEGAGQYESEDH